MEEDADAHAVEVGEDHAFYHNAHQSSYDHLYPSTDSACYNYQMIDSLILVVDSDTFVIEGGVVMGEEVVQTYWTFDDHWRN